ncbi:MAG TPA: hypothetical protein PKI93_05595 [Alphaproteobacteria bacterium]|nr:hypothetical protein [Alphaproteobacteria bacterium]HNS44296.1 hypothetical protein [Alphaproteobacteria bacterium]
MTKLKLLTLSCAVALSLSACADMEYEFENNARYWQRSGTTDAIYQQGPKAQQMLFQDMANCTAVVNEMERMGAIKESVPAETWDKDAHKIVAGSPESRMGSWDTPERDGYMRTEMYDFHDFEGCMNFKGWERVKYVNYKTEERARDTYLDTIGYERYRTKVYENTPKERHYNE